MGASVVVSTYNRPAALNRVLKALSRQTLSPAQIVVGDDGSTDDTRRVLDKWKAWGLPVEHCWHPDQGYRKTMIMNQAFARVTSKLTIFLDGDCIPAQSFVEDHIAYQENNVILACPRILASPQFTHELESNEYRTFFENPFFSKLKLRLEGKINRLAPLLRLPDGQWRNKSPTKWQLVRGCNFSVATEHVWSVDGFEESLFGWGPDDSDLAVRLLNQGLTIKNGRFAAPVLHLWHREESRTGLNKNREYLQGALNERRTKAVRGLSHRGLLPPPALSKPLSD